MTELKCPVCGKQMKIGTLDQDDSLGTVWLSIMPCDCVCSYGASRAVWQALIDTKKKLDIAVDALKELKPQKAKGGGYWAVKSTDAIKLINTALEQTKDKED